MTFSKYLIVTGTTTDALSEGVNALIGEGYQPIGGVSHADLSQIGHDHYPYIQAMVKPSETRRVRSGKRDKKRVPRPGYPR